MSLKEEMFEKWRGEAMKVEERPLYLPLIDLLADAETTADLVSLYWEPAGDRPGLSYAGDKLPPDVGERIRELRLAIAAANDRYRKLVTEDLDLNRLMQRAHFLCSEISAAVEWYCDSSELDVDELSPDPEVVALNSDANSPRAMAEALGDIVEIASACGDDFSSEKVFDRGYFKEAVEVSDRLREIDATFAPEASRAQELLSTRNRLCELLQRHVRLVRAAARYVFRNHEEIALKFESSFARRRQNARRRAAVLGKNLYDLRSALRRRTPYSNTGKTSSDTALRFIPYV